MIPRFYGTEQRSRGGLTRARKARTALRPIKTELLQHIEAGCSQREAARREGIPESTARGILRNPEILRIVPNLHSRQAVPRAGDRHHAARQRCLTPKRVAALHDCYTHSQKESRVRVLLKPHRPHRAIIPESFALACGATSTRQLIKAWTETTGEWLGRTTIERLILDFRNPSLDYRNHRTDEFIERMRRLESERRARRGICSNRLPMRKLDTGLTGHASATASR